MHTGNLLQSNLVDRWCRLRWQCIRVLGLGVSPWSQQARQRTPRRGMFAHLGKRGLLCSHPKGNLSLSNVASFLLAVHSRSGRTHGLTHGHSRRGSEHHGGE